VGRQVAWGTAESYGCRFPDGFPRAMPARTAGPESVLVVVDVAVISAQKQVMLRPGVVKVAGAFHDRLPRGQYSIVFDNRGSLVSSKTVSGSVYLAYYR